MSAPFNSDGVREDVGHQVPAENEDDIGRDHMQEGKCSHVFQIYTHIVLFVMVVNLR